MWELVDPPGPRRSTLKPLRTSLRSNFSVGTDLRSQWNPDRLSNVHTGCRNPPRAHPDGPELRREVVRHELGKRASSTVRAGGMRRQGSGKHRHLQSP